MIIVGAMAVDGNAYDGHTLEPQLDQIKELTGSKIKKTIVDIQLIHGHRMLRNYLSGTAGDKINTLLAAEAYNMKKPTCYRNPE